MNREDVYSTIIYLMMAAIILVTGFVIVRPAMEDGYLAQSMGANFAFLLISLVIGVLVNVILLEFGHLVGSVLGGYKVLSFNILGLCFYKKEIENGKTKFAFKFKSFDGFTGQTIVAPKKEKANPMYYVFIPLLLFLSEFAGLYCAVNFIKDSSQTPEMLLFVKYGIIVLSSVGACFLIYDYFPGRLDSLNDGYRLVLLNKKVNLDAYNTKLNYEAEEFFGREPKELKTYEQITDFTAKVNLDTALIEFSKGNYEKAINIIDTTIVDPKKMSKATLREFRMNKSYIYFLTKPLEEATKFYKEEFNEEEKDRIRACKSHLTIRLYILYIGLVEKSKSEIEFAKSKIKKCDERVTEGEKQAEKLLIEKALNKVIEVYPNLMKDSKNNSNIEG